MHFPWLIGRQGQELEVAKAVEENCWWQKHGCFETAWSFSVPMHNATMNFTGTTLEEHLAKEAPRKWWEGAFFSPETIRWKKYEEWIDLSDCFSPHFCAPVGQLWPPKMDRWIQNDEELLMHNNKSAYSASLYVDEHGEEDPGLRRGRPLFLNDARYRALEQLWRQQGIPREVAQIRSTSDRVIRDNWY